MMPAPKTPLPQSFVAKKKDILQQLSVPVATYDDLSPKGSVDVRIRDLIDEINQIEGCVTTSSCSGRVSVFLEGRKQSGEEALDSLRLGERDADGGGVGGDGASGDQSGTRETTAGVGGKGGGGRWLYVSHDEVQIDLHSHAGGLVELLGMEKSQDDMPHDAGRRFIHFKFEPMILHVLTASFDQAQIVISAALQAGFRESGAINLTSSTREPPTPMVAVRSMGLSLESLVGFHYGGKEVCNVTEETLRTLLEISNARFRVNTERIMRFRELLRQRISTSIGLDKVGDSGVWEDAQERRERKRAEGLRRKELLKHGVGHSPEGDL